MDSIQSLPAYHGRNAMGKPFLALPVPDQIRVLVDALGTAHLHRSKLVSTKTCNDRFLIALLAVKQLKEGGFQLRSITGLAQKHIDHLANRWRSEKLAPATIQTRFSHLRWLTAAVGKQGLVREPGFYGLEEQEVSRTLFAQQDKSWSAKNYDASQVLAKVAAIDPLVAVQFRMIYEYGLRVREAILMRPLIAHVGDTLRVEEGTKGGRTRVVQIRSEAQREAIELAKSTSRGCRRGTLIPEGSTFETAKNRFYYVCKLAGITKGQLGVTAHGLRHEYANDLYEALAGQKTIVRGASQILDRVKDREARRAVTQDLGHKRLDITASYTGPMRPRRFQAPPSQAPEQQS